MTRFIRWLIFSLLLNALFIAGGQAATVKAASCSSSDVQTAINTAASGDTVAVPACTATSWTTQVLIDGTKKLTLVGATSCTGTGAAPTSNLACVDNTNITLSVTNNYSLVVSCTATNQVDVSGFTFTIGAAFSHGKITFFGPFGIPCFRLHHSHLINTLNSDYSISTWSYGLIDHMLFTISNAGIIESYGDHGTIGYNSWNAPTQLGSNQALYIEDSIVNQATENTEGVYDGYAGAKIVARHNTVNGTEIGGGHGTDSGPYRSVVVQEVYNNALVNNNVTSVYQFVGSRGGTLLYFNNSATGSGGYRSGVNLVYNRTAQLVGAEIGTWGMANPGLDWSVTATNGGYNTFAGADWQANHTYANLSAITDSVTKNNFQNQNGSSCTSGGSRPSFNTLPLFSTAPPTADNTCSWINVGGSTGARPGGVAGWCAANPDTQATSDATCAALVPGDTASRYFDNNGGTYPYRDQIGRGHNQALFPVYEWGNSGANPSPLSSNSPTAIANRDYYNGIQSGPLSARPVTCSLGVGGLSPGVAYFATDVGTQGTLYACGPTANNWMVYYTPYVYPHPLQGGSANTSTSPPTNLTAVVQ
jgi:hypothetical protein